MPILKISRQHTLSLAQAQSMAHQWARDAERDFGMETVLDKTTERCTFKRSGVHGSLVTSAQRFELELHLGFLLGAFKDKIKQQIEHNLDQLLGPAKG